MSKTLYEANEMAQQVKTFTARPQVLHGGRRDTSPASDLLTLTRVNTKDKYNNKTVHPIHFHYMNIKSRQH